MCLLEVALTRPWHLSSNTLWHPQKGLKKNVCLMSRPAIPCLRLGLWNPEVNKLQQASYAQKNGHCAELRLFSQTAASAKNLYNQTAAAEIHPEVFLSISSITKHCKWPDEYRGNLSYRSSSDYTKQTLTVKPWSLLRTSYLLPHCKES